MATASGMIYEGVLLTHEWPSYDVCMAAFLALMSYLRPRIWSIGLCDVFTPIISPHRSLLPYIWSDELLLVAVDDPSRVLIGPYHWAASLYPSNSCIFFFTSGFYSQEFESFLAWGHSSILGVISKCP